MSVKVMSFVWGLSLPATEKLVLLKLADCANDAGANAFPALETVADECGLSRRGVQKILDRLVSSGRIEVQAEHTSRRPTTYRVSLTAEVRGEPGSPLGVNVVHPSPALECTPEVNGVHPRGEPGSPLEVNGVHPIHQGSVSDPSGTRQRARDGRRAHPLDEPERLEPWALDAFERLWMLYPVQEGRVAALKAWHALRPDAQLAEFIVQHVTVRLRDGWAEDYTRLPWLHTFLNERRWQERYRPPKVRSKRAPSDTPDGMLVMRTCLGCGVVQEGVTKAGEHVYPPCPQCAPAGVASDQARARMPA